jgi:hypothetical protein
MNNSTLTYEKLLNSYLNIFKNLIDKKDSDDALKKQLYRHACKYVCGMLHLYGSAPEEQYADAIHLIDNELKNISGENDINVNNELEKEKLEWLLDAVTSFTISHFSKAIGENFDILEDLLEKYEAPDERIWMVDEIEACLHPSTVEAIYDGGHCFNVYKMVLEDGYEYGDDISEEYEDFPELREGEWISGDIECKIQFGDQTVTEFCKEYGIPEDEMQEVLDNCLTGAGFTHTVYIEKTQEYDQPDHSHLSELVDNWYENITCEGIPIPYDGRTEFDVLVQDGEMCESIE